MLGISIMAQRVHRWARDAVTGNERGDAIATYTEMGDHLMSIYPSSSSVEKRPQGFGTDEFFGATSYGTDYEIGDRVGTEDTMLYNVVKCATYSTHQELELKRLG